MERRSSNIDRIGVSSVSLVVERDLKWIFREQTVSDFGIDAEIEEVKNGNPTGKIIKVQIKSGLGNVTINKEKDFVFYFGQVHYYYWLGINVPVIIVLYDPETECIYWSSISKKYVKDTPKGGRKITIKKNNVLSSKSISTLENLINSFSQNIYFNEDYFNNFDLSKSEDVNELIDYAAELLVETANSIDSTRISIEKAQKSFKNQVNRLRNFIDENKEVAEQKMINKEIREVSGNLTLALNIFSRKLKDKITTTAQTHAKAIQLMNHLFSSIKKEGDIQGLINALLDEKSAISDLILMVNQLSNHYKNDTTKVPITYREAQHNCADTLEDYSQELNDLISMINGTIEIIKHK